MKKLLYIILSMSLLSSCSNFLDIEPTNMIGEDAVKNDPVLIDAYLSQVQNSVRWHTGKQPDGGNTQLTIAVCGAEFNNGQRSQPPFKAATNVMTSESGANKYLDYWPYSDIRSANEVIDLVEGASYEEDVKKEKIGTARFLRAYMYFEMVKRYGGVPLITRAQNIEDEDLYLPRSTEKELYDFIGEEMDSIVNYLPSVPSEYGRISKWAAYALKSRAMLYAASIAENGVVQLGGILGIPSTDAEGYYKQAFDAAVQVINSGVHPLYNENADKVANYGEISTKDGNCEIILAEIFNYDLLKAHSYNIHLAPHPFQGSWGSNTRAYFEFMQLYEEKDGSENSFNYTNFNGSTRINITEMMENKDPRFQASFFYPESPWQGSKVYFHKRTLGTIPETDTNWPSAAPERNLGNGMMIRKDLDESIIKPLPSQDGNDFTVFRTGEMYLNAAEAAFKLNKIDTALVLINDIRERAGITMKTALTFDDIVRERAVELAFEEHRYWDLRRWRTAVEVLNGKTFTKIEWNYYYDTHEYVASLNAADYNGITRPFEEHNYYFPLSIARLADNPKLVENPGY